MRYIGSTFTILFISAGHPTVVIPALCVVGFVLFLFYGGRWLDRVTEPKYPVQR